jgi:hypothetical protein
MAMKPCRWQGLGGEIRVVAAVYDRRKFPNILKRTTLTERRYKD